MPIAARCPANDAREDAMLIDQFENPFLHMLGADLHAWRADYAEFRLALAPWHLNRQGTLQGGVIATLLDVACGYSGLCAAAGDAPRHGATLSLAINFLAPVNSGTVRAIGQRTGGGRNIYFAEARIVDEAGVLIATAQGSFKYRPATQA
jgi:uncharacterized protein (TIGR00369 family)